MKCHKLYLLWNASNSFVGWSHICYSGTRKNSNIWDTSNNCHNCPKNRNVWCIIALMHPKDADGMANSIDPDQTASSEAVWSWSALFAETYLSQYIEFIRYQYYDQMEGILYFQKNSLKWKQYDTIFMWYIHLWGPFQKLCQLGINVNWLL